MRPKHRELLIKLSLAVFGMALSLGMVEGLARLLLPAPGNVRYIPDDVTGYRHAPSQKTWVRDSGGEYAVWFSTNAHGDPDGERALDKPAGVFRVAVIGDSMVEAAQVPPEQRFTSLLEQELAKRVEGQDGPVRRVEVLNFGTAGYGTAQEWLYYREHVRRFDPDVVVLVFLPGNDIKNNNYSLEVVQSCRPELGPFYTAAEGELVLQNKDFPAKARERFAAQTARTGGEVVKDLLRESRVFSLARRAAAALRSRAAGGTAGQVQLDQDDCQTQTTLQLYDPLIQQTSADWSGAWQVTEAILRQFAQDAAGDGAAFQVVTVTGPWEAQPATRSLVLPAAEQARYDWDLAQRMTAEMTARLGIANLAVLPAMRNAVEQEGEAVHFQYNGHYTAAGHQILARELLPILEQYIEQKR